MALIRTDQWLRRYVDQKKYSFTDHCKAICKPLLSYFNETSEIDIHQHLLNQGLFPPQPNESEIEQLIKRNVWSLLHTEFRLLQKEWQGPDVPVFIFPSNHQSKSLQAEFNGKTGLSYKDKIFLFVSSKNSDDELRALLTHEYNHTCRLKNYKTDDLNLLETIILEGLAEKAVEERLGNQLLAPWTRIYDKEKAMKLWKRYLEQNKELEASSRRFNQLLYGTRFYPKHLGYNIGFHITSSFCENQPTNTKSLLKIPAQSILKGSDF